MSRTIEGYHAHVYFIAATQPTAQALRDRLAAEVPTLQVSTLRDRPVGPHTRPSFEIQIPNGALETAMRWLMIEHGDHSVLIHPLTGDEVEDHRDFSLWLGPPLPLDFRGL